MTDLSNIVAAERGVDIKHPSTGEPVGLRLTLLPETHPKVREASRKALNDRLQGKGKVTAEKIEENRLTMLVASVGGWEWQGEATFKGEKPEFTDATLRKVIEHLPWMQEQIDQELGDRSEFFRGPEEQDR
ncbi:MAG: hypothetical protein ACK4FW_01435 [Stenotrophomonas sp.]|jgi:predicted PP-loop superfamily ATPase